MMPAHCRLCASDRLSLFFEDKKRNWSYFTCEHCGFVFRDPETYLAPETEKSRYETHNNSIENLGYVRFLSPVVESLSSLLKKGAVGLDYGSGPGPILDQLFAKRGFQVSNYDPFFAPDKKCLEQAYDFVTCTEAFEHFYFPAQELERLSALVRPGGYLALMTQLNPGEALFSNWGYRMDNTHVGFLNDQSLSWLTDHWGFKKVRSGERVFILQKKA